jgi:hypothetical protein
LAVIRFRHAVLRPFEWERQGDESMWPVPRWAPVYEAADCFLWADRVAPRPMMALEFVFDGPERAFEVVVQKELDDVG